MAIERINLAEPIETRDGTLGKDSRTVNAVFEQNGQHKDFIKRPGLAYQLQVTPVTPPATLNSQGLVSFGNNLVAVISNTIYKIDTSSFAVTTVGTTSATTNKSYFSKTTLDSNLVIHNTVNAYQYTSGGVLTTLALPVSGPYVPGSVFLDNYTFIGCATNNRIYNSNVGDPSTWDALNYLTFEQTADTLVGICKHLNYLVAFGKSSMQFYYDAANASGSPLAVAQSYTLETGCANGDSIVSTDNTVIWVGTTKTHGRSVYLLDGVSPVKISTASIDKCLETDGMTKVSAYAYKFYGHSLYILTLHTSNITLVYDLHEKMWTQWTQYALASADQPNPGTYVESYFRGVYYAEANNVPYVLDDDTAVLYYFSNTTYQDNGQPIYCRSVTEINDNGSTHRKFYGRLEIVGDKIPGAVMQVRHTGDDYNTWSSYRTVDLNASRPQLYLGGSDRRRAWDMLCTSNTPLRLETAEIDFRIGEMDQEQAMGSRSSR
jgi:Phage stabilisation protein